LPKESVKFLCFIRKLQGKILGFANILGQIIELEMTVSIKLNEFEISLKYGPPGFRSI
jgi:hypothetical protein